MLDSLFRPQRRRFLLNRIGANPLTSEIEVFAEYLSGRRHSLNTIRSYILAVEHFGHWIGQERIPAKSLRERTVESFLEDHLPACSCPRPKSRTINTLRAALHHLLKCLRQRGEIPQIHRGPRASVDRAIQDYDRFLVETCGLAMSTRVYRVRYVREFLRRKFRRTRVDPAELTVKDFMQYVSHKAEVSKPGTAKVIVNSLRSYVKYLQLRGVCGPSLLAALPSIPDWKLAHIPKTLSPKDLSLFLSSFDRSSATGQRDYAMALCLAECGLRVCEVAQLRLADVEWRQAILRVPGGKIQRERLLPLPKSVGHAIAAYLRDGRPRSTARSLFLRHRAPVGQPVSHFVVRGAMRRAYDRSGAEPWSGPHSLRHTLAARMLAAKVAIKEIADVLGHTSIDTTSIYAKVDLTTLKGVAMPWPEEVLS